MLDHYVTEGVEELSPAKLPQLLELKYGGLNDALAEMGIGPDDVRDAFCNFQKFLYEEATT